MTDAHETRRQDVKYEASCELETRESHDLLFVAVGTVAPAEGDSLFVIGDDAGVGEGDPARVSRHVANDLLGAGQGSLCVDDPALARSAFEKMPPQRRGDSEGVVVQSCRELGQHLSAADPPQDCVRQEETRTAGNPAGAIVGDASACNEAVNVW